MVHWVQISEDSALHNPLVAQEFSKMMMLPRDEEELESQTMSEVVDDSLDHGQGEPFLASTYIGREQLCRITDFVYCFHVGYP